MQEYQKGKGFSRQPLPFCNPIPAFLRSDFRTAFSGLRKLRLFGIRLRRMVLVLFLSLNYVFETLDYVFETFDYVFETLNYVNETLRYVKETLRRAKSTLILLLSFFKKRK